jgi:hypothetical protein
MSLGVHALHVGNIVLALAAIHRRLRRTRARRAADNQPHAGADSRTLTATHCCTRYSADRRTDGSATDRCIIRRLFARAATNLLEGKITAYQIIPAKLLKVPAGARQSHNIRPRRNGRATGEKCQRSERKQKSGFQDTLLVRISGVAGEEP